MRVGGMGFGAVPSPVGFPDFYSYQTAVIANVPACPPPYDPICENPRDAAISQALAQWKLNPLSCGNIVCDSNGQPQIMPAPTGSGSGYNTNTGFVPVSTAGPSYTPASPARCVALKASDLTIYRKCMARPKPYPPPQPSVVNPSPPTLLTTTGSTATAPGSVVTQANGTASVPWSVTSIVAGYVPTCPTGYQVDPRTGECNPKPVSSDLIAGIPNWVLIAAGGLVLMLITRK